MGRHLRSNLYSAWSRLGRTGLILVAIAVLLITSSPLNVWAASTEPQEDSRERDIHGYLMDTQWYDPTDTPCGTPLLGTSIEGHTLPAAFGGTGFEEPINEHGQVPSTNGHVSFYTNVENASTEKTLTDPHDATKKVSLQDLYRNYYITMRWRFALWNWNGTAVKGPENADFYRKAPRVIVTNQRTGKSIIAVVLESGPAPWTGVDRSPNNLAKQGWSNPQDGTPQTYKGRVSGFPPQAIKDLGATMRMSDGSGDTLVYSWAPDQNALPGPFNDDTPEPADTTDTSCAETGLPVGDYVGSATGECPVGKDGGIQDGYANNKLYKIRICIVHGIRVNVRIAQAVDGMLNKADREGYRFTGGGFRTMEQQIATRRANGCPDIYKSPSSACRVATAPPGYSNHQMGLAIDFSYNGSLIRSHANSGFSWLNSNASKFGLKNFPVEPWHWSVDGR